MANSNNPHGFIAVDKLNDGSTTPTKDYAVAATHATNIFIGDPIVALTGGTFDVGTAAAGITNTCVASGFLNSVGQPVLYLPAGEAGTILGVPVANQLFTVQASAGFVLTDVNSVADYVAGAGNTGYGISGFQLDSASFGGASPVLRVIGLDPAIDNSFGTNAKVIVEFVQNLYQSTTNV